MKTALALVPLLLVAALVLSQLLLPGLIASRVEDQLTRGGGTASVAIRSFPALRLLLGDGSRIEVRGEGLQLKLAGEDQDVFGRLEGFGRVGVELTEFTVGPLRVARFEMERDGEEPYRLRAAASSSIGDLVRVGTRQLGLAGSLIGGLIGGTASATLNVGRTVPLRLDMRVEANDGGVRVLSGGTSVAGYPTGPLGEAIAESVLASL
jgi:hypothetical protein